MAVQAGLVYPIESPEDRFSCDKAQVKHTTMSMLVVEGIANSVDTRRTDKEGI